MRSRPVILIGAARSGTKFFRDQLAKDDNFSCVPYDVNYVWRLGNAGLEHDILDPDSITERRAEDIRNTLFKLGGVSENGSARLIEKTVSNTLRIPFIERIFPDAIYVHLVRDGRAVVESSRRMWQAPPDKSGLMRKLKDLPLSQYGYVFWFARNYLQGLAKGRKGGAVWGPRYDGIMDDIETMTLTDVVARQWNASVEKATQDLEAVPTDRKITARYEDLARDPELVIEVASFIGAADPEKVGRRLSAAFDASNLEKWRGKLTEDEITLIESHAGSALNRYGYLA